jgi:HK97 family phage portal protein
MSSILKFIGIQPKRKVSSNNELLEVLYSRLIQNRNLVLYNFDPEKNDFIVKGYGQNAEVYKIINKIVTKCNAVETILYNDTGEKSALKYKKYLKSTIPIDAAKGRIYRAKALDIIEDEDNDLLQLLKRPNNYQSWREMMELFRIFYFVQGEAFLYRETALYSDIALSLHVAPANWMTPVFSDDPQNIIKGWKLKMHGGVKRTLDVEDVFHLKMTNPIFTEDGEQLRGLSPLVAGLKYLQLDDKSIETWIKSIENEGAKGIISPNTSNPDFWLQPEQVKLLDKEIDDRIVGVKNKNKIVASSMPLQYTQIGLSPDALSVIQALEHSQINLCDLWGVPATLFDPNPTYQNQKEAGLQFVRNVVIPYLEKEEQKLNEWLVKPFSERDNKNYYIDNDTSQFDELAISLDDRQSLAKILTLNEMRIIEGYDTIDNPYADEVFIEPGRVPLSDMDINFDA